MMATFGMPNELDGMLTSTLINPLFRPYAAWDGDELVAGGLLFLHGQIGSLSSDATKASHRGRGAQTGLLAVRAKAASAAGCRWLVTETAETGTSLENVRRAGLEILYIRQNWLWEA
jgi:hypothetical protein